MDDRGRSQVFMTALIQVFGLSPFRARLRDVSRGGCKIATGTRLRHDEIVLITLPSVGEILAHVVWSERGFCGLRFERDIEEQRVLSHHTFGRREVSRSPISPGPFRRAI